jgi:hypothetical protein
MSDIKKDGGPAFPCGYHRDGNTADQIGGLTIRDWFAGMALQGLTAGMHFSMANALIVEQSFELADAILAEREKQP